MKILFLCTANSLKPVLKPSWHNRFPNWVPNSSRQSWPWLARC